MIKRWTFKRKAKILNKIMHGDLSEKEACEEYGLSHDEITEWLRRKATGGVLALRVTSDKRRSVSYD